MRHVYLLISLAIGLTSCTAIASDGVTDERVIYRSMDGRATLDNFKIVATKAASPHMTFSFVVTKGKAPLDDAVLWFCIGNPPVLRKIGEILDGKPLNERLGLLGFGNDREGWAAQPCSIKKTGDKPLTFTGDFTLSDKRLRDPKNVSVSIVLFDDEGKATNQISAVVDFQSGKLVGKPETVPIKRSAR